MRTIRLFGHEVGIEFWCRPLDIDNWQFGRERHQDAFDTRLFWFGPLHFAVCQMPVAQPACN